MIKKVIIFSTIIFVIGITSCSMWDDVDKNTPFEIPVADNINVTSIPNPAQWIDIPVFLENDVSKNSISEYSINTVKIATNSDKTKLFFQIIVNSIFPMATRSFVFLISNDYSCDGYFINVDGGYMMFNNRYNLCNNTPLTLNNFIIAQGQNYNNFEILMDIPSNFSTLKGTFFVSVFSTTSTGGPGTVNPSNYSGSSTKARWAKLR